MTGINLIPTHLLLARRRSRHLRRWLVALVVTAGASVLPVLAFVGQQARLSSLSQQQAVLNGQITERRDDLLAVDQLATELEQRCERARMLQTKRSWPGLLLLVVESMPPQVWLTSLQVVGPQNQRWPGGKGPDHDQNQVVMMEGPRQLNLAGFALDHQHLSDFITQLNRSGAFDRVQRIKAQKEPIFQARAVRFELSCYW